MSNQDVKPKNQRRSVRSLRKMGTPGVLPAVMVAVYDAVGARLAEEAGADLLLVGDSVGMTVHGFANTIPVTMEMMLMHTAAVVRGREALPVVADMPFLSCQVSVEETLRLAARFLQEAGADAVKVEGGAAMAPVVARLVQAGIPVLGHIGLLPQSVLVDGGFRVHGRTEVEAAQLRQDALAVERAGAFAVVLECVPAGLAAEITASLSIPTIGIGAGRGCDGQVQVFHDLLGLSAYLPRHARRYAEGADLVRNALRRYAEDVRSGAFPGDENASS